MENLKLKLILASSSPRRKELLGHLKLPYEIIIKNIPEESDHTDPVKFSAQIALMKNEVVFMRVRTRRCRPRRRAVSRRRRAGARRGAGPAGGL